MKDIESVLSEFIDSEQYKTFYQNVAAILRDEIGRSRLTLSPEITQQLPPNSIRMTASSRKAMSPPIDLDETIGFLALSSPIDIFLNIVPEQAGHAYYVIEMDAYARATDAYKEIAKEPPLFGGPARVANHRPEEHPTLYKPEKGIPDAMQMTLQIPTKEALLKLPSGEVSFTFPTLLLEGKYSARHVLTNDFISTGEACCVQCVEDQHEVNESPMRCTFIIMQVERIIIQAKQADLQVVGFVNIRQKIEINANTNIITISKGVVGGEPYTMAYDRRTLKRVHISEV